MDVDFMEENKEFVESLSNICVPKTMLEKSCKPIEESMMENQQRQPAEDNPILQHLQIAVSETSMENVALSREISDMMNKLNIRPKTFPNDLKDDLRKISLILKSEGLSDIDETALVISMDRKRVLEQKRQREQKQFNAKYKELLHRHSVLERKLKYLKENVDSIGQSVADEELEYKNDLSDHKLLTNKLATYNDMAGNLESEIDSLYLKQLEPYATLKKYKAFLEKKGQLAEINEDLRLYGNLPPNLLQAKALLDSKQQEYAAITQQFFNMAN